MNSRDFTFKNVPISRLQVGDEVILENNDGSLPEDSYFTCTIVKIENNLVFFNRPCIVFNPYTNSFYTHTEKFVCYYDTNHLKYTVRRRVKIGDVLENKTNGMRGKVTGFSFQRPLIYVVFENGYEDYFSHKEFLILGE